MINEPALLMLKKEDLSIGDLFSDSNSLFEIVIQMKIYPLVSLWMYRIYDPFVGEEHVNELHTYARTSYGHL